MEQKMKALSLGPAAMEDAFSLPPSKPADPATCVSPNERKISSQAQDYLNERARVQYDMLLELMFLLKKEFPVFQLIGFADLGDGYLRALFGKDGKSESTFTVDVHCPRKGPVDNTVIGYQIYSLFSSDLSISAPRVNIKELEEAIVNAKAARNIV